MARRNQSGLVDNWIYGLVENGAEARRGVRSSFTARSSVFASFFAQGNKYRTLSASKGNRALENKVVAHGISIAQKAAVKAPVHVMLCLLWLLVAGAGAWGLLNYESTPSKAGETPSNWPGHSHIAREPGHSTLIMFAHPHCPCSSASIGELNRLLTRCEGPTAVHILFIRPKNVTDDWTETTLRKSAEAIPGAQVQLDPEGEEARRFGAESSGYVVLYSPEGNLLFSGGITGARGHAGDNAGENVVVALLNGQKAYLKHTAVFGCSLLDDCTNSTP